MRTDSPELLPIPRKKFDSDIDQGPISLRSYLPAEPAHRVQRPTQILEIFLINKTPNWLG